MTRWLANSQGVDFAITQSGSDYDMVDLLNEAHQWIANETMCYYTSLSTTMASASSVLSVVDTNVPRAYSFFEITYVRTGATNICPFRSAARLDMEGPAWRDAAQSASPSGWHWFNTQQIRFSAPLPISTAVVIEGYTLPALFTAIGSEVPRLLPATSTSQTMRESRQSLIAYKAAALLLASKLTDSTEQQQAGLFGGEWMRGVQEYRAENLAQQRGTFRKDLYPEPSRG